MQGVCGIHNTVSDKWYVGQSVDVHARFSVHRSRLKRHTSGCSPHLQASWDKYGANVFSFVVLEEVLSREELTDREEFWIQRKKVTSAGVYNIRPASHSNFGLTCSEETRKKMSGPRPCLQGIPLTAAHRAKLSAAHRGKKLSMEHRAKISAGNTGKIRSPETRELMAAAHRGRKLSPEHCAKLSAARKKRRSSPETRARVSAALKKFADWEVLELRRLRADGATSKELAVLRNCSLSVMDKALSGRPPYDNVRTLGKD